MKLITLLLLFALAYAAAWLIEHWNDKPKVPKEKPRDPLLQSCVWYAFEYGPPVRFRLITAKPKE